MKKFALAATAALGLAGASAHAETVLDLATTSPQDAKNGGIFYRTQQQPTGTGVIDPFVRIQRKGQEDGYNTDGVSEFDTKDNAVHNWTHSIKLSDVPVVTINGVNYREFILDINETSTSAGRLLAMNEFQVYTSDTNVLSSFNRTTQTFGSPTSHTTALVYDLDKGLNGDQRLRMDYSLGSGSGSGDMFAYVQDSLFAGKPSPYLYLYSSFGVPDQSDAGFEEWAVRQATPPVIVPIPATAYMGVMLMGAIGAGKWIRRRKA
jgi:hypothetical protein